MPELVEDCFRAAGAEMHDFLTLLAVDPMYRACFADGSELRVRHGRGAMAEEIRTVCGAGEAANFERFCDWVTRLYNVEMPNFIARNYDGPAGLARPLRPAIELLRLGAFRKLAPVVNHFFADDRLRRIFSFQSLYAGLAPYQALALYAVIAYMDAINGVYVPVGGMHALPVALAGAAEKAGVEFRYNTAVGAILLAEGTRGAVRGVRLADGRELAASTVVCNADLPVAYRTLLPGMQAPRGARRGRYSPSAFVWHAGVAGELPPGVAHHNIHFGREWNASFRALIERGSRMEDPSILVTVPTIDEPAMAPPGRHVLYVLEPVPNLDGQVDWSIERARARDDLVAAVARAGYPVAVDVESSRRPAGVGGARHGTGYAVLARAHLLPDRSVPAPEHRAAGARPRVHRFGDRSRCRRADGARLGQARG